LLKHERRKERKKTQTKNQSYERERNQETRERNAKNNGKTKSSRALSLVFKVGIVITAALLVLTACARVESVYWCFSEN